MGEYAAQGLEETSSYLTTQSQKHAEMAQQIEGAINNLDRRITDYLVEISSGTMSEIESAKHTALMDSVRDIERIGDHFENIIELIDYKISNKVDLTDKAQEDLNNMFDLTRSEEHTSELQSRGHLVCRLLLEKKNTTTRNPNQ